MVGTFWAFVPAIVAIILALITKQVYVSLFVGIFVGAMFYAGGNPLEAMSTLFSVMSEEVGGNATILVFLVVLGIFVILAYDMKLFTGLVATIPHMKLKNLWKLPTCFIGNAKGVAIVAVLVYFSPVSNVVVSGAKSVISAKLYSENWAISSLCSGVLCGILITLSVLSVNHSHKKGLSANVGVIFPIIVFAFCGFDHSVANMFYFYYLGEVSWQVVGYIMLTILGNVIGGVLLPLVIKLKDENEL